MQEPGKKETVAIINRYFTPFAIFLVLLSIIFSEPTGLGLYLPITLLSISLLNNIITATLADRYSWIIPFRLIFNILVNIFIVYFLVAFWEPIWYLFLLTPLATAVYGTRIKTFASSLIMSGLLLGIYKLRGLSGPVGWGQASSKAALIIVLSLFINTLAGNYNKKSLKTKTVRNHLC